MAKVQLKIWDEEFNTFSREVECDYEFIPSVGDWIKTEEYLDHQGMQASTMKVRKIVYPFKQGSKDRIVINCVILWE